MYVDVPNNLTEGLFIEEFGLKAYYFYLDRIRQREDFGRVYLNPLKTMYIWAKKDKATNQGFYTSLYVRNKNSRRMKNYGGS